jgi:eight-cysteine-cluster-containing protein
MWRALTLLILLTACSQKSKTADPAPDDAATEQAATTDDGAEVVGDAADSLPERTPETMYKECFGRVEGPSADGECTTDKDCQAAGCSTEVCTTAEAAKGIMTTCEIKPCFKILDACGCVEGRCSWSLKDSLPEPPPELKPATTLPTTLPIAPPAEPNSAEDAPAEDAPAEDAPAEDAPAEDAPADGGE